MTPGPANELVDPQHGGVLKENIAAGRALAREAAEMAIPPESTILDAREDAITMELLGDAPLLNASLAPPERTAAAFSWPPTRPP